MRSPGRSSTSTAACTRWALLALSVLAGCGGGSADPPPTTASKPPPVATTDPQNLFDCLGQAHARVAIDPQAAPKRFVAAGVATRAASDGRGALSARFRDGTRADYDVFATAAEARRAGRGEVRGNVLVVYAAKRGRAVRATADCVPR